MPAKTVVELISPMAKKEKEGDVFKLECERCRLRCSFEDGMAQCARGHTFCRSCGVQNVTNCCLCIPPPKEEDPECAICCEEVPFVDMVACTDGCLFCPHCLKLNVENDLANNKSEINCINFKTCGGLFPLTMFEKALSPGMVETMGKHQYHVAVSKVKGLWSVLRAFVYVRVCWATTRLLTLLPKHFFD